MIHPARCFFYFVLFIPIVAFSENIVQSSDSGRAYDVLIPTFLGNSQRNYYGNEAPNRLELIWKQNLGTGYTVVANEKHAWSGCGWTGQPLLVRENGKLMLIQGAYDHHLKKIDAADGHIVWQYLFDDVIKGTGTILYRPLEKNIHENLLVLQGSRRGTENSMGSPKIYSFRAVSFTTGEEIWRLNVPRTPSYSRDVDASALVISDTIYIPLENATLTILKNDAEARNCDDGFCHPQILSSHVLYTTMDCQRHNGNLVAESSPARLGDHLYISAGSGHVYGYDLNRQSVDWDFFIGSDMDGSVVITSDSCLLVSVEKQYIPGHGGVFKLNPARPPSEAVVWYFPVPDFQLGGWQGGVIGSCSVNDQTRLPDDPLLAAFTGINGFVYVVDYSQIDTTSIPVWGPMLKRQYPTPKMVFQFKIGSSISTPLLVKDKLIAAGYGGVYLFKMGPDHGFTLLDHVPGRPFEATPVVWDRRIYSGSRDGYLYCFGEKSEQSVTDTANVHIIKSPLH